MLHTVAETIARAGLVARGALSLEAEERVDGLAGVQTLVLAGFAGREGWGAFAGSKEAQDGRADPLDRWSRRIVEAIARDLGAKAFYPFGGPPFWPFQRWAQRAEPVHPSPLGLLIHPTYGLWHSYRGALGFSEALPLPPRVAVPSPCEACAARPCLTACPVGAFSPGRYDVDACAAHLGSAAGAPCMSGGCLARLACPVGAEHGHGVEQARFTMKAFLSARMQSKRAREGVKGD